MNIMHIFSIFFGLSSGIAISGAVFAFISSIGIVPRLAAKTKTNKSIVLYEEAIIWGGIFGCVTLVWQFTINLPNTFVIIFGLFAGIFFGALAMSLAEVLDVLPILSRRLHIKQGLIYFVISIALGKMTGSLIYFIVEGFNK